MTTSSKTNNKMTKENTKLKEEFENKFVDSGTDLVIPERETSDDKRVWRLKPIWSFIDHALTEAREGGYEAGKKHIDTEMRKAMNDWHKHEQTGLEK